MQIFNLYIYIYSSISLFVRSFVRPFVRSFVRSFVHSVLVLLLLKGKLCKTGRERLKLYQSKDPIPILLTYRKKKVKVEIVEDKNRESSLGQ